MSQRPDDREEDSADRDPILLVDDDDAYRYAVARILRGWALHVIEAENVMLALDLLDQHTTLRLAVVDVRMPGGQPNGLTFALMARHRRENMRTVLISAVPSYFSMEEFEPFGGVVQKTGDLPAFAAEVCARLEVAVPPSGA